MQSTMALALAATDGRIFECNQAFLEITGLKKEHVLHASIFKLVDPAFLQETYINIGLLLQPVNAAQSNISSPIEIDNNNAQSGDSNNNNNNIDTREQVQQPAVNEQRSLLNHYQKKSGGISNNGNNNYYNKNSAKINSNKSNATENNNSNNNTANNINSQNKSDGYNGSTVENRSNNNSNYGNDRFNDSSDPEVPIKTENDQTNQNSANKRLRSSSTGANVNSDQAVSNGIQHSSQTSPNTDNGNDSTNPNTLTTHASSTYYSSVNTPCTISNITDNSSNTVTDANNPGNPVITTSRCFYVKSLIISAYDGKHLTMAIGVLTPNTRSNRSNIVSSSPTSNSFYPSQQTCFSIALVLSKDVQGTPNTIHESTTMSL